MLECIGSMDSRCTYCTLSFFSFESRTSTSAYSAFFSTWSNFFDRVQDMTSFSASSLMTETPTLDLTDTNGSRIQIILPAKTKQFLSSVHHDALCTNGFVLRPADTCFQPLPVPSLASHKSKRGGCAHEFEQLVAIPSRLDLAFRPLSAINPSLIRTRTASRAPSIGLARTRLRLSASFSVRLQHASARITQINVANISLKTEFPKKCIAGTGIGRV
ncbi:hypothetical protein B0J11DRAFT_326797 [Dendryphion nanum]|uniref:Uncharacterized protein n=1 Tax=Dendryphion nanum TaxID=256645 RepID=A0A9P9ILX5_9PLEO|nr:hypothetical protein B0J11DRAFT_326797 [Dendryphion nanum]